MKQRVLLIAPLLGLASLRSAPAAAGSAAGSSASHAGFSERFRFHAGAPLLAPAASGADGSVCVGTADGYIHLLGVDGTFRWSYSVHGAVTRRPVLAGQLWFVATSTERIYALTPEGTLYWVFRPPSPIASELAADATGVAYFVGTDHFLYGVGAHGGVSLRAAFGEPKAGPSTAADGSVWAENQAGNVVRVRGQELRRLASESPREFDFGPADALRDPEGHEWRARADGVLEFVRAAGTPAISFELTNSPLLSPSWSSSGHYALVSARDGLVIGLSANVDP